MKAELTVYLLDRAAFDKSNKWVKEQESLIKKEKSKERQLQAQQNKQKQAVTSLFDSKINKINKVTDDLIAAIDQRRNVITVKKFEVKDDTKALLAKNKQKKGLHGFLNRYKDQEKAKQQRIKAKFALIHGQDLVEISPGVFGGQNELSTLRKQLADLKASSKKTQAKAEKMIRYEISARKRAELQVK